MKQVSEVSPAVNELNQLFNEGGERGLWKSGNKADFARALDIPRRRMSDFLRGEEKNEQAIVSIIELARRALERGVVLESLTEGGKFDDVEGVEDAQTEFDRFYLLGVHEGRWRSMTECGKLLGVYRHTIHKFRTTDPDSLQGHSRTSNLCKKLIGKMRRLFQQGSRKERISEAENAKPLALPREPIVMEKQAGSPVDLAALISAPAIERIDALEESLMSLLRALLDQSAQEGESAPDGIVPSKWADEVVAGRMEIADQHMGSTRFVVTAETFRKLLASPLTGEEVGDTKNLAEIGVMVDTELRRRLEAYNQMERSKEWDEAIDDLVPALSKRIRESVALAIVIEKIRECDVGKGLIRAARQFESFSSVFNS